MLHKGALAGVRVLDLSRLLPGPYCSMILADHGAEVIAIEDRRFQQDNLFFEEINRNKRHMSLNLKSQEGKEIFYDLAGKADVVIEGFRPGVVKRLGVDYDTLRSLNPRVVYCSITGYGQSGPKKHDAGHDVNYLSTAGVLNLIGEKNGAPVIPAVQVADIMGGSMQAAVGILLALYERERSGEGQYIDISMTDGIVGLLTLPRFFDRMQNEKQVRSATTLSHRFACYNTYETSDGRYLALGAVEKRFWEKLCQHLGGFQYVELQYNNERRDEVIAWLREQFKQKTLAEWQVELDELDICCTAVATLDEVLDSDLFHQREMICTHEDENGDMVRSFGIPVKLSRTPGSIKTPPARFGADTAEVLLKAGYTAKQIEELRERGVV